MWWNPAGLALAGGTDFVLEAAPTFGRVRYDRASPDYGPPVDFDGDGVVDPYDYGGRDLITSAGVLPFAAVRSDLGVDRLGVGVGLAIPYGRLGAEKAEPGPGSFHLREGEVASAFLLAGAGYRVGRLAVGVSGALVRSTWHAQVDAETLSIVQANAGRLLDYADPTLEHRGYVGALTFDHLHDTALSFGTGLGWSASDRVAVSVAYLHGARLAHTGPMRMETGCPPEGDVAGHATFEALGLCAVEFGGRGGVAYDLPARVHAGVALRPAERWSLEPMAGFVAWHVFDDYHIDAVVDPDTLVESANPEDVAARLEQHRRWARDSRDTFWAGLGAAWQASAAVELGARALYDHPAIPLASVSTNNYDAPTVGLTASVLATPRALGPFAVGGSAEQLLVVPREVVHSVFAVTLDEERNPERTYYPSAAGTYRGAVTRLGLTLQGRFP